MIANDEGMDALPTARDLSQTIEQNTRIPETLMSITFPRPLSSPFGQYSVRRTKEEMADIVGRIISDHLNKYDTAKQSLVLAFKFYFEDMSIDNDSAFTIMQKISARRSEPTPIRSPSLPMCCNAFK